MPDFRITLGTYQTDVVNEKDIDEAYETAEYHAENLTHDTQQEWFVVDVEKVEGE